MRFKDILSGIRSNASGCRSTTQEGYNMVSVIMLAVIGLCIGWIVWIRRRRARVYIAPIPPGGIRRETLALDAFAHGNSYLAEGKRAGSETCPCRREARRSGTAATRSERHTAYQRIILTRHPRAVPGRSWSMKRRKICHPPNKKLPLTTSS